jgi:hypothetical protein
MVYTEESESIDRDDSYDETPEQKGMTNTIVKAVVEAVLEDRKKMNTNLTTPTHNTAAAFNSYDSYNRHVGKAICDWVEGKGIYESIPEQLRSTLEKLVPKEYLNPANWSASARVLVMNQIDSIVETPFTLTSEHIQNLEKNMRTKNS